MGTQQIDVNDLHRSPEELAKLRSERDQLKSELERLRGRRVRGGRFRRSIAALLVILACISIPVAVTAGWTKRTLFDTDRWVNTVGPIVDHESVTDAMGRRLTGEVMTLINADELIAEALPARAAPLAGPLTGAIEDSVQEQASELLATDRFKTLWVNANRFAHTQIVAVLRGEGEAVTTADGKVVLNLLPVINEVLTRVEARGEEILGKDVNLPELSTGEVPEVAREKLESALGVTVPPDLGEIVVYESDKLEAAQDAVKLFDRGVVLLGILALLFFGAALWVSKSRRRTLIQMSTGIVFVFVIIRRLTMQLQDQIADLARPENRTAAEAIADDLFRGFFNLTLAVMIVLLGVIVVSLVTGPYPWARSLRQRTAQLGTTIGKLVRGGPSDEATAWVRAHREGLRLGGAIGGILLLLVLDVSWPVFLLIIAAVGAYELVLYRMEPPGTAPGV
jgi:CheY-like chemotaxis protein